MRILEEYDPEFHMRKEKELSYEEGIAVGREEGREEGIAVGREEGRLAALRVVMKKMNYSLDEAMRLLEIPEDEWEKYRQILGE